MAQKYGQGSPENDLTGALPSELEFGGLLARMGDYAQASRAPNIWRAYQSQPERFTAWCTDYGLEGLPASGTTVAAYLTDYTGVLSTATLERRLYALSALHRAGDLPSPADSPEVHAVWSGIERTHRTDRKQKTPPGPS